jgi:photosystem II stability/assembly factor-like uncharacterized protein
MDTNGTRLNSGHTLIVSTRKGIFFLQPDRDAWRLSDPVFLGHIINHAVLDPRDGRTMLAAARTGHLGPTLFRSEDAGRTWSEARRPPAFDKAGPGEKPRVMSHTFWLSPGHADEPGVWFAGSSPQALWTSRDAGLSWESVRGFNDHPDYEIRTEDPQAGTPDGPVLHSIQVDPRDPAHMYFGLSGGGVYETLDHGETWNPLNRGMASANSEPETEGMETDYGDLAWQEVGPQHDPHCLQLHPANPDILFQQNHCGIYRLQRPEVTWDRIGRNMPEEVGDIGFVMGVHPRDTQTCWVFPMDGTDVWPRTSPDGRPAVFRTRNAGESWERQDKGLPSQGWFTVKRQSMTVSDQDPAGVFFGTTSGEVWGSADEGDSWIALAAHLPEIYAVESAEIA